MKLNLPDVTNVSSVSTINSNFTAIEQELQNRVLYRDNPDGEPNTLETPIDANGQDIYNVNTTRTTRLYIDGERVVPSGVVIVDGDTDISGLMEKAANLSDVQSASASRINLGLGNVNNTSDINKPISSATASALAGKQATLVSGTNIKTINGNSVLGTGDLTLTGVGETNTTSNLGSGQGLAAPKSGVNLPFKSLTAGTNVTLVPTANDVTINATVDTSTLLVKANNLSDVQSAPTSRTNLGIGNVDNTSDANKPISIATATALSGKQATLVSGSNIKTINGSSVLGSGDLVIGGGNFIQAGTGAVTLTMQNKVREHLSVKDFGAIGDGVADDTAACQLALNQAGVAGGAVYFPAGDYKITGAGLQLPLEQITCYGDGQASRLFSSGTIFTYPTTVYIPGYVAVQNLKDLFLEQTADGTTVVMMQTWDALGKIGPTISGCTFYNSSLTTTTATCLYLRGTYKVLIHDNQFIGRGIGGGPTSGIGGFGIRFGVGIGTPNNIMNVQISNNMLYTLAFPIWMDMRNPTTGGVIEGTKIIGNDIVAGYQGITTNWSLSTTITGNQISDFHRGIVSSSDFDMSITGNSEITATNSGINLVSGGVGYGATERITITGNNIGGNGPFTSGVAVRLSNVTANDQLKNIVISSNSFRGNPGGTPGGNGISLEGSNTINGCTFSSNAFGYLASGLWFSGVGHTKNSISGNTFTNCTAEITNLSSSGSNGGHVSGYSSVYPGGRYLIQAGADVSSATPTINFPLPFKAGTTPVVSFGVLGTGGSNLEVPAISALTNTSFTVDKKVLSGGSVALLNYTMLWTAMGEAP